MASSELLPRRMEVQKSNQLIRSDQGYILGDISKFETKSKLFSQVELWKKENSETDITLVVATPPCQGMSVANHKKQNEIKRNSLVIESIAIIKELKPKFFLLENVRSFLTTECTDLDNKTKSIFSAINENLLANYSIESKIINFKDYGAQSSRTRTLVIGVRRDITDISPLLLFPGKKNALTLAELIGDLPRLEIMGEIAQTDVYHSFKPYDPIMRNWIKDLKPGQSAFENKKAEQRPSRIIDGTRVENKEGNGDKYKRNLWDRVAPCVHTRNDILASQSTIHPVDDRVFSIRELSRMMGLDESFKWSPFGLEELNLLPEEDKRQYLNEHEMNIRQCLGEGVPAQITYAVGENIIDFLEGKGINRQLTRQIFDFEKNNPKRNEFAAYLTRLDIASTLVSSLPNFKSKKTIRILEPSVGAGSFVPLVLEKYADHNIEIDLLDIDSNALATCQELIRKYGNTEKVKIRYLNSNYLEHHPKKKYDLTIGNPPFGKKVDQAFSGWQTKLSCKDIFAKFIEHALGHSVYVAFIVPKTLLSGPEHLELRNHLSARKILSIHDFGEKAFSNIKIETIGLVVMSSEVNSESTIQTISYPLSGYFLKKQGYVCDPSFPTWLLYRNKFFDEVASQVQFGIFLAIRDREISSKHLGTSGNFEVIRACNIPRNGHDSGEILYLKSKVAPHAAKAYLHLKQALVAPNLSYYPRATWLLPGQLVDGSAAVLCPIEDISKRNITFFSSDVFFFFYRIARNYSTRSLNIDKLSVFYWGLPRKGSSLDFNPLFVARSSYKYLLPENLRDLPNLFQ